MATIIGLDQFEAKMRKLTLVGQRVVLKRALKRGGEPIRQEAESRAPRGETGKLSREEIVSVSSESAPDQAIIKVGPSMKAFYGLFVELGTAHSIQEPFLEPALQAKKEEAIREASSILRSEVLKAVS